MPMLDELCKVYKAKLIKFIPIKNSLREPMALAEYNHRIRPVSIILVPGAQLGELVTIHQACAVESFSNLDSLAYKYKNIIK